MNTKQQLIENYRIHDNNHTSEANGVTWNLSAIQSLKNYNTKENIEFCDQSLFSAINLACQKTGIKKIGISYLTDKDVHGHYKTGIDIVTAETDKKIIQFFRVTDSNGGIVPPSNEFFTFIRALKEIDQNAQIWNYYSLSGGGYGDGFKNIFNDPMYNFLYDTFKYKKPYPSIPDSLSQFLGYPITQSWAKNDYIHTTHLHFRAN